MGGTHQRPFLFGQKLFFCFIPFAWAGKGGGAGKCFSVGAQACFPGGEIWGGGPFRGLFSGFGVGAFFLPIRGGGGFPGWVLGVFFLGPNKKPPGDWMVGGGGGAQKTWPQKRAKKKGQGESFSAWGGLGLFLRGGGKPGSGGGGGGDFKHWGIPFLAVYGRGGGNGGPFPGGGGFFAFSGGLGGRGAVFF